MPSVALLFFTLLSTLSLLPPCQARCSLTIHAEELNNWHRSLDREAKLEVVMAGARSLISTGRTQVEVADEKAGNDASRSAKGQSWSSLSNRSKVRALKEHPGFDLDYAGPRMHTPSHN